MSIRPLGTSSGRPAWHGDPPQASAARQRLLEAAARCIGREGMAGTTVAAIAAEAGVSRQTVYRYFKGRDEIALRTILAASQAVRAKIDRTLRDLSDPADMIVETVVLGLGEVRSDPVLRSIWDAASLDGLVARHFTRPAGIAWVREALAPAIQAAGWSESEADSALELILRLFLSLVISPSPERDDDETRAFLHRHLVPGLGLAAAGEA